MIIIRILAGLLGATVITFFTFWIMGMMIKTNDARPLLPLPEKIIEFPWKNKKPPISVDEPSSEKKYISFPREAPSPIVTSPYLLPSSYFDRYDSLVGHYVTVSFTVTREGLTKDITVLSSSDPIFEKNAIKAIKQFKYIPVRLEGYLYEVKDVIYHFDLEELFAELNPSREQWDRGD